MAVNATHVWVSVIEPRDEIGTIALQMEENIHRRQFEPYEEAAAYQRMLELGLSIAEIASRVKKRDLYVRERLQFASAASGVHEHVVSGELTPKKAALIARISDGEEQVRIADIAARNAFTTEQVREAVEQSQTAPRAGRPRRYLAPEKTLAEAARVVKWLHRVGKTTHFKALTAGDIKAFRAAFGTEMMSSLRMVCDLIDRASKNVPASALSTVASHEGNVPSSRNHGDEWPAGDISKLESWIANRRLCSIEQLAEDFGRSVSAVEQMAKVLRARRRA